MLVTLLLTCSSCGQHRETAKKRHRQERNFVVVDGYRIPVFHDAEEQLEYARSFITRNEEQKAALEAVKVLFPHARKEVAESLLDLIYFDLGGDYRLASRVQCQKAVKRLEDLIHSYRDVFRACARAQWYIGWIYTDLLKDRAKGLEAYYAVFSKYPDEVFYISSPFDSSLFNHREKGQEAENTGEKHWWGALALLEIYRHTVGFTRKLDLVSELVSRYPTDLSTGYALVDLLSHHRDNATLVLYATRYIETNKRNRDLLAVNHRIRKMLEQKPKPGTVR